MMRNPLFTPQRVQVSHPTVVPNANIWPEGHHKVSDADFLMNLAEEDFSGQEKVQNHLFKEFLKWSTSDQYKCMMELLQHPQHKVGGMMYKTKLALWTVYELLKLSSAYPELAILSGIQLRLRNLLFSSKFANRDEMLSLRQKFSLIVPEIDFRSIDEKARKRFGDDWNIRQPIKFETNPHIVHPFKMDKVQLSRSCQVKLVKPKAIPTEKRQHSNIYQSVYPDLFNLIPKSPQSHIPKQLPQRVTAVVPSSSNPPPAIIEIDDEPSEHFIDYDHFDRNILFSPVPSNQSETEEEEEEDVPRKKPKVVAPIPFAPIANMDDFLKSCREELVRKKAEIVETEKEFFGQSTKTLKSSLENVSGKKETNDANKKTINIEETEIIKQRVIKDISIGAISGGHSSSNTTNSKKLVLPGQTSKTWAPSMMPSKPNVEDVLSKKDTEGEEEAKTKPSKVLQDIKRKLQKTQINTKPVVNVHGNIREIILPVDFSLEEYVDHLLSSSFQSHGIKQFCGKYVIYVTHKLKSSDN